VSILIAGDAHWIAAAPGAVTRVAAIDGEHDWAALREVVGAVPEPLPVEIAAEDGVQFQTIVSTMDVVIAGGLSPIAYVEPSALAVRPAR
jgi:hypothetical protein